MHQAHHVGHGHWQVRGYPLDGSGAVGEELHADLHAAAVVVQLEVHVEHVPLAGGSFIRASDLPLGGAGLGAPAAHGAGRRGHGHTQDRFRGPGGRLERAAGQAPQPRVPPEALQAAAQRAEVHGRGLQEALAGAFVPLLGLRVDRLLEQGRGLADAQAVQERPSLAHGLLARIAALRLPCRRQLHCLGGRLCLGRCPARCGRGFRTVAGAAALALGDQPGSQLGLGEGGPPGDPGVLPLCWAAAHHARHACRAAAATAGQRPHGLGLRGLRPGAAARRARAT
mmetsp:Transcript_66726/g.215001  ORF Transcript_66726/g.215001 Transcript_66726/m.215001 type:complete len:283 (-) Transcript_66726:10-858(-)